MSLPMLTLILALQLLGEMLHLALGIPIPGPVIGMALLFAGLLVRGRVSRPLEKTAFGLLENLSLLFVPAGVGVMLYLPLLAAEWPSVVAALLASTVAAIAVTGWVMVKLGRSNRHTGGQAPPLERP